MVKISNGNRWLPSLPHEAKEITNCIYESGATDFVFHTGRTNTRCSTGMF